MNWCSRGNCVSPKLWLSQAFAFTGQYSCSDNVRFASDCARVSPEFEIANLIGIEGCASGCVRLLQTLHDYILNLKLPISLN